MELAIDWFVPPGERLAAMPHCHGGPQGFAIEHFDVLDGSAACSIAGVRQEANSARRANRPEAVKSQN